MEDNSKEKEVKDEINVLRPDQLMTILNQFVIGQPEAKKRLCVAVYNHYKRLFNNRYNPNVEIEKSNVLLCGPTGCGKTLMVKTIAKALNVPCYIQDSSKLTQAGYVGSDVEECLAGLLRVCNYDIKKAEIGIVFLDEFDKIAKKGAGTSITRDVGGEGVQQSLLKIVEGDLVGVPPNGGRKHPEQKLLYVDTTNILFIASGAFVGLDSIIEKRIGHQQIGFNSVLEKTNTNDINTLNYLTSHDLKEFGLIPEIIGRFPVTTFVNPLSKEDLVKILKEPRNSIIKQYEEIFKMDQCELIFTNDAIDEIADIAFKNETGARGLRTILETVLLDYMYSAPSSKTKKVKITDKIVKEKCEMLITSYSKMAA